MPFAVLLVFANTITIAYCLLNEIDMFLFINVTLKQHIADKGQASMNFHFVKLAFHIQFNALQNNELVRPFKYCLTC